MRRARLADARLWAGLALVIVSMLAGAALLSRSDDTVVVWQAGQDLAVGAPAVGVPVRVALANATDAYIPATEPLDAAMATAVPAGALIPRAALTTAARPDSRQVTLAVDPLHAPIGVAAGDVVDVWATPADAVGTAAAVPQQVIGHALVASVSFEDVGIGGQVPVVLEVRASQAELLVAASRSGVIDLVAVPLASQRTGAPADRPEGQPEGQPADEVGASS